MARAIKLLLLKVNIYGRDLFMDIQKELEGEASGKITTVNVLNSQSENTMTKPVMLLLYIMSPLVKRKQDTYSHCIVFAFPDGLSQGAGKFSVARNYWWVCVLFLKYSALWIYSL